MNNLSIKTLIPHAKINNFNTNSLNIESLKSIVSSNNSIYDYSIKTFNKNTLLNEKFEKRNRLLKIYYKYYGICIEKIKYNNKLGKTDLIFTVPDRIIDCNDYISKYCLEFISQKLENNKLNTVILDNTIIFITWKFIESNI